MICLRRVLTCSAISLTPWLLMGPSCTALSEFDEADALRESLHTSFAVVDRTLTDTELFNTDFLNNLPSYDRMQTALTRATELDDQLISAQAELTQTEDIYQRMETLYMPDWYQVTYREAARDQIDTRKQAVSQYQEVLVKEQNFALAITSFYDGWYTFSSATTAADALPELDPANLEPLKQQVFSIQQEVADATSDFNSAAAYVNVELFTRMRDSAVDYKQALDILHDMTLVLENIQSEPDPLVQADMLIQMEQLSYTLDGLLAGFSAELPSNYLDGADQFTQTALDDFVDWRSTHLDPLVSTARASLQTIQEVDSTANTLYSRER